jgi:hypothetical protein
VYFGKTQAEYSSGGRDQDKGYVWGYRRIQLSKGQGTQLLEVSAAMTGGGVHRSLCLSPHSAVYSDEDVTLGECLSLTKNGAH